ncbi:MAG: hypothetical protein MUP45_00200 [Candidatus Marinimicrobia bacterium]|nr:hypothetical protein [Candidatus Neomarinimicrobiota bacterium]
MGEINKPIEHSQTNEFDVAQDRGEAPRIDVEAVGEGIRRKRELDSLRVTLDIIKMASLEVLSREARKELANKINELVDLGLENAVMGTSRFFESHPHAKRLRVELNLRTFAILLEK